MKSVNLSFDFEEKFFYMQRGQVLYDFVKKIFITPKGTFYYGGTGKFFSENDVNNTIFKSKEMLLAADYAKAL